MQHSAGASFLPATREDLRTMLDAFLLDKAVRELDYELRHRLAWARIPLRGILELLAQA